MSDLNKNNNLKDSRGMKTKKRVEASCISIRWSWSGQNKNKNKQQTNTKTHTKNLDLRRFNPYCFRTDAKINIKLSIFYNGGL